MQGTRYSKKRKALIGPDGQPLNLLRVNDGPTFHTYHQETLEAKNASVEESMIVGDKKDNQIELTGAASGTAPSITVTGSDTNIGLTIETKGSGYVRSEAPITVGESDENSVTIVPAVSGQIPYIGTTGNDATIGLDIRSKGRAAVRFTGEGTASTNCVQIQPAAAGTAASISAIGVDTIADLRLAGKGSTSYVRADNRFKVATTGENNSIDLIPTDGNYCEITTANSVTDPNVSLYITTKGSGLTRVSNKLTYEGANSAAYGELSVLSGTTPQLAAAGSNADIDVKVTPKGLGTFISSWGYAEYTADIVNVTSGASFFLSFPNLNFNTFPAGALTITGSQEFKNTSGRSVRFLVSYSMGSNAAYTGSARAVVGLYNSGGSHIRSYATSNANVSGASFYLNGSAAFNVGGGESFKVYMDVTPTLDVGMTTNTDPRKIRLTIQQIA